MEIIPQILSFSAFVCLSVVLPGVFITIAADGAEAGRRPPEALGALSLLSGFIFHFLVWGALRWTGFGYGAIAGFHAAITAALGFSAMRRPEQRLACAVALRSIFSIETAAFLALALPLAAFLTYDKPQFYYGDELFRMSLVWAAQKSIPAQNMLVHSGVMKYYYAAEFYTASACAVTKIPIETVYFRFLIPLNWALLFFGMRGALAQYKPDFRRWIPHASFLLFFLAHPNMLVHFTFRQNTFALGMAVLAVSALCSAYAANSVFVILVCSLAPAVVTMAKAPCGALLLVFLCVGFILGARNGSIGKKSAVAACFFSPIVWFLCYRAFSGPGFKGMGSLLQVGSLIGSMQELLPELLVNPELMRWLTSEAGLAGKVACAMMVAIENVATALVIGIVPVIAVSFAAVSASGAKKTLSPSAVSILWSAVVTAAVGMGFYCFVHYRVSGASDRYWMFFGFWLLSATAYPLALEKLVPRFSLRLLGLSALVPLLDFVSSAMFKLGFSGRVVGLLPAWLKSGMAMSIAVAVLAAVVLYVRYSSRRARRAGGGSVDSLGYVSPAAAGVMFLCAAATFLIIHYNLYSGEWKDKLFLATWLLAAGAIPLFLAEIKQLGSAAKLSLLVLIPVIVAISNAPKYIYWASELKNYNGEQWTGNNQAACNLLNSRAEDDRLYLHNRFDVRAFALLAMCRRRAFITGKEGDLGVWDDKILCEDARREAVNFFNGDMREPCFWLKSRNIGYIYWDSRGRPFRFIEKYQKAVFLDRVYQSGSITLYAVGSCGAKQEVQ